MRASSCTHAHFNILVLTAVSSHKLQCDEMKLLPLKLKITLIETEKEVLCLLIVGLSVHKRGSAAAAAVSWVATLTQITLPIFVLLPRRSLVALLSSHRFPSHLQWSNFGQRAVCAAYELITFFILPFQSYLPEGIKNCIHLCVFIFKCNFHWWNFFLISNHLTVQNFNFQ